MENFYKITKAQADLLGRFEYQKNFAFDPYCSEQKDGTFLVSEEMYLKLKENSIIKKIDFTKVTKIATTDTKTIDIDGQVK
jgi:hypothetical protein